MSPRSVAAAPSPKVVAVERRTAVLLAQEVAAERRRRGWSLRRLAAQAGVSPTTATRIAAGEVGSLEAYVRLSLAFGWEPQFILNGGRPVAVQRDADPVHAAMGEIEAAQLRTLGHEVRLDEPYQHYQFAGRADLVAIDREARALLHLENRTQFPDTQGFLGSWNAKRAYLADSLAVRLDIRGGWRSIDHVVVALWSSEVLHSLRLRTETFRSAGPDPTDAFEDWWAGERLVPGARSSLIVFDPLPDRRSSRRRWIGLDDVRAADPRYRGYAEARRALKAAGLV